MNVTTRSIIAIAAVLFVLALLVFVVVYNPGAGLYVTAYKVNETPVNYMEISMEELDKHPYVKQAVMQPGVEIKVPLEEQVNVTLGDILFNKGTDYIKVDNECYKIEIIAAD